MRICPDHYQLKGFLDMFTLMVARWLVVKILTESKNSGQVKKLLNRTFFAQRSSPHCSSVYVNSVGGALFGDCVHTVH